jgi:hypothetical protein
MTAPHRIKGAPLCVRGDESPCGRTSTLVGTPASTRRHLSTGILGEMD